MSWRTVITKTQDKLKMRDDQMVIISENEEKCFPCRTDWETPHSFQYWQYLISTISKISVTKYKGYIL